MSARLYLNRRPSKPHGIRPEAFGRIMILAGLFALGFPHPALAKQKPPVTYTIPTPPNPDFSALQWVLGDWTGKTSKGDPPGEVQLSVAYDLDKRVMVFHEHLSLAAAPDVTATDESWLGILSADKGAEGFVLEVFSSTGFITRYRLRVNGPNILFNPEGGQQPPPGWLFRRTISRTNEDNLTETVETAPPGKSFFEYYSAKLTRATPPGQAAPPATKSSPKNNKDP